jgi:signal transduction histidine kinase/DNA-binding response OmpR family regulator
MLIERVQKIFLINLIIFLPVFSEAAEKFVIGFSQCTTADIWRETMYREMLIELAFYPELEMIMKDAKSNNIQQIKDIEDLIKQGIDLLIVSPNESEPLTPIVEKAFKSGIPVIVIDRNITTDAYTAFVGGNNYLIGKEAGNYAAKLLKGKGRIIEITGLPGSTPAIDRHRGFQESLNSFPDISIVKSVSGKWNWSDAKTEMEKIISDKVDFDLVFAYNDVMANGAHSVAKENGIENKYYLGIDGLYGEEGGIQYVINGMLDATFLYPTGGEKAIQIVHKILNHLPFEKENLLPTVVIDSTNAKIIKLQTDQVLSLQVKIENQNSVLSQQISAFKSQRNLLFLALVLLGLNVILVILVFRAFRNKIRANKKLELQKQQIERRNNEISKQRDKLIEVSEKLEEATKAKLRFFTNISHEFRTPLTLIVGPLEDLIHSGQLAPELQKQFNLMHRNSLRLLRLINQLMDFRKLENEKMKLQAGEYNVVAFLKEIHESFIEHATKKGIDFQIHSSEDNIILWFDWDKLDKVIFNLLSNAFKFTSEGGQITINVKKEKPVVKTISNEELLIQIKDSGRGISLEHQNRIFDRFYQVEKSQEFQGTGLGLSLSKGFIKLHHGKIKVESEIGKGTSFFIRLPMGNSHLKNDEMFDAEGTQTVIMRYERSISNEIHFNPEYSEVQDLQKEKLSLDEKPVVLIVEDQKDVREYIKDSLGDSYIIFEASNGLEGLRQVEEEEPDLIISDIMMPEMDGLEMTRKLKSELKTCHIPVILLTAKASQEQKLEGLEEGADSYIPKPFNRRHLQVRVKKLLELRKKLQETYRGKLVIDEEENQISRMDKKFLNKISKIVEEQLDKEELSVEELSEIIGLSRVHLYRKVKKLTGLSVSEFVRSVKLRLSLDLIKNSGKSISEIAYEVGFSSPSYFTKCFKEQFGISPTEFAKK